VEAIAQGVERYRKALARFAPGGAAPRWTGPFLPSPPRIPNDTTVVVVTNGLVASAGEGFVMRVRQAGNVFVVGENTHGALTFGNVSLHQLPRSGLKVWLPINLNLFADGSFREELGLEPDWWVPAGDAVNLAVAALRAGTIPTVRPLPPEVLAEPFVPEDPRHREHARVRRRLGLVALGVVAGAVVARRMRRRSSVALSLGLVWMALGLLWVVLGRSRGPLLSDGGLAFVAFGVTVLAVTIVQRLARVTAATPAAPIR
jgi:hypothetical protein